MKFQFGVQSIGDVAIQQGSIPSLKVSIIPSLHILVGAEDKSETVCFALLLLDYNIINYFAHCQSEKNSNFVLA